MNEIRARHVAKLRQRVDYLRARIDERYGANERSAELAALEFALAEIATLERLRKKREL